MAPKPPIPPDRPRAPRFKGKKKATRKKESITLRELSKQLPNNEDFEAIMDEIACASDRSAAIVLASVVDRYLESAIIDSFVRNDRKTKENLTATGGSLDGFFSKIHLGYAMGLYNQQKCNELEAVRRIRNSFAHSAKNITFETPQISVECSIFRPLRRLGSNASNREKYISACERIAMFLIGIMFLRRANKLIEKGLVLDDELKSTISNLESHYDILSA
ncbi:hypothetical protein [Methylocystis heyeri]|uniref:Uncharacterized protein n=1 Tax=Methylocystis heyeri TaxID=391905 RepID=A0A6B8KGT6_9HYPH|nr:hypothetical protein [Methylocystis heyeri]QGM46842.1 hypothetical protein H2LOC_014700 [Methylocystis heyeri]